MSQAAVHGYDPWLAEPPACNAYLPGGICTIDVVPPPRWPIAHRNLRALHGMLCEFLRPAGFVHHATIPHFSLIPTDSRLGWSVYMDSPEAIRAIGQQSHPAKLFDRLRVARFGPVQRVRSPFVRGRGRMVVHLEALTPVVVRRTLRKRDATGKLAEGHRYAIHQCPTSENLRSALTMAFLDRLGLSGPFATTVLVELLARETHTQAVVLGDKYGCPMGWVGSVVLAVNAPALWLLRVAETLGLGGRTAFGFGRVVVRET